MPTPDRATAFTPELRASFFHYTVFLTHGIGAVCFALWLSDRNITSEQIGIINAVPMLLLLAINIFIGRLADKASDWKFLLVLLSLVGGVVPFALYLVNDFWGIVLVWSLCALIAGSVPPIIDAATVRMTQRRGTDFGFVRAWGTVGYMSASVLAGVLAGYYGAAVFVPLYIVCALLRAGLALQLPRFRAPLHERPATEASPQAQRMREVIRLWFILPLVAFALIQMSHAVLAIFAALVWKQAGIPAEVIGPLIAVGAAAEALMMFLWRRIGWRISARQMILLACLVTAGRWTIMAFNPPVWVLFGLQLLHAITYGVGYMGSVQFVAKWTSEDIAAEAQGFSLVLTQGVTVVGLLVFGLLVDPFGPLSFLLPALFGALGALCVVISLRMRPSGSGEVIAPAS